MPNVSCLSWIKRGILLSLFFSQWNILPIYASHKFKNLAYRTTDDPAYDPERSCLDVFKPKHTDSSKAVFVFIHGGSWDSGKKNTYGFLGRRLAGKGHATVIINYRLSPQVNYEGMTSDCAKAISWVYEHISEFGGNKNKIVVMGHSAGAHLAGLIANDPSYFDTLKIKNPIKACVLIDGFGLDMFHYFKGSKYSQDASFRLTFSNNSETWKKASPIFYLKPSSCPHLLLMGGKTFPGIRKQMTDYKTTLEKEKIPYQYFYMKHRNHVGMILQFYFGCNKGYAYLEDFVQGLDNLK